MTLNDLISYPSNSKSSWATSVVEKKREIVYVMEVRVPCMVIIGLDLQGLYRTVKMHVYECKLIVIDLQGLDACYET